MGNLIGIYTAEHEKLGALDLGLSCIAVLSNVIIKKYNPAFNMMFGENIDKQLEPVYENCTKPEEQMMKLMLCDKATFEGDDINDLQTMINEYPEDMNDRPKRIMEVFLELLKEHKWLETKYEDVYSSVAVVSENV